MSKENRCSTCGSDVKEYRNEVSAWDADVKIRGKITTWSSVLAESGINEKDKIWYCGPCPDAWHEHERRKRDRRT